MLHIVTNTIILQFFSKILNFACINSIIFAKDFFQILMSSVPHEFFCIDFSYDIYFITISMECFTFYEKVALN